MAYAINSLTLKMTLRVEICSILYQSEDFGQRCALLNRVSPKNVSQSCYPSAVHIYAIRVFHFNVDEKHDSKPIRCGKWSPMCTFFSAFKNRETGLLCSAASLSLKCISE